MRYQYAALKNAAMHLWLNMEEEVLCSVGPKPSILVSVVFVSEAYSRTIILRNTDSDVVLSARLWPNYIQTVYKLKPWHMKAYLVPDVGWCMVYPRHDTQS